MQFHQSSHETGTSSQLVPVHDDLLYFLIDVSVSDLISITYINMWEQNKGPQTALFLTFHSSEINSTVFFYLSLIDQ